MKENIPELSLDDHVFRSLPKNYSILSIAAEVAALLKRHAKSEEELRKEAAEAEKSTVMLMAEITTLVYFFDETLSRYEQMLSGEDGKHGFRSLRILKDKFIQVLEEAEYKWWNPINEPFDAKLSELVEVDGWKYSSEYDSEKVIEVREPIILHKDKPVKEGSVVVGTATLEDAGCST